MLEPLKRGLVDVNAYTRRAATMSCAKVFRIAPEAMKGISFHVSLDLHCKTLESSTDCTN